jgi:hypothetical protein
VATDKDVALGILGASIGLAGLLLVFVGFLLAAASQIDLRKTRVLMKTVASFALVPFLCCLACALESIYTIEGSAFSAEHLLFSAKIVLGVTAIYAILATIFQVK